MIDDIGKSRFNSVDVALEKSIGESDGKEKNQFKYIWT